MGLEAFRTEPESGSASKYRRYDSHEQDEKLQEWVDTFEGKFPEDIRIDFIEVSPAMDENNVKYYHKSNGLGDEYYYIRVAEHALEYEDWELKNLLLETMTAMFLHQEGFEDVSQNSTFFKWVCGRVGCLHHNIDKESEEFLHVGERLLDFDMAPPMGIF